MTGGLADQCQRPSPGPRGTVARRRVPPRGERTADARDCKQPYCQHNLLQVSEVYRKHFSATSYK